MARSPHIEKSACVVGTAGYPVLLKGILYVPMLAREIFNEIQRNGKDFVRCPETLLKPVNLF